MKKQQGKIFGIGLSRTGTQSLSQALRILGYRAIHYPEIVSYKLARTYLEPEIIEQGDAFTDVPVALFYKELDALYPNSRFILTVRNIDDWLASCGRLFEADKVLNQWFDRYPGLNVFLLPIIGCFKSINWRKLKIRKVKSTGIIKPLVRFKTYNTISFDEKRFREAYVGHTNDVLSYFSQQRSRLLVMDVCGGDSWEKLCAFLNKSIPEVSFPAKDSWLPYLRERENEEGR